MRSSLVGLMIAGMVFWAGPAAAQGLAFEIPMPNWDQPYQEQYMDMGPMSVPDYHQQYESNSGRTAQAGPLRQDRLRQDRLRQEREDRRRRGGGAGRGDVLERTAARMDGAVRSGPKGAQGGGRRRGAASSRCLRSNASGAAIENERNWVDQMRGKPLLRQLGGCRPGTTVSRDP